MSGLLIRNAEVIVTMDDERRELAHADLRLRDGVITEIGQGLDPAGDRLHEAAGCVITPGLINTHHHLFQTLTRAVPPGRMPCCLAGCRRFIRFGRALPLGTCGSRRWSGWRNWRSRAAR